MSLNSTVIIYRHHTQDECKKRGLVCKVVRGWKEVCEHVRGMESCNSGIIICSLDLQWSAIQ